MYFVTNKAKFIFLIVQLFWVVKVCSQAGGIKEQIDSLQSFLKENPSSIFIHYDIAELYEEVDSAKAIAYIKKGLDVALKKKNAFAIGKGKFLLGDFYSVYDYPKKAEFYLRSADTVLTNLIKKDSSEEHLKLWVRTNFNIGVVRSYQGINEDFYYLNKIRNVAEKIGYYEILAKANTNLAIGLYNSGQLKKAYEYFEMGGLQHLEINDVDSYIINRLLLSSCLLQLDSLEAAKTQLDVARPYVKTNAKKGNLQLYHTILAEYFVGTENYDLAIDNLEQAEAYLQSGQVQTNKLPLYMTFVKTFRASGYYQKGLEYTRKSLDFAQVLENKVIEAELYKELTFFQDKLGNYKEALESLGKFVAITDTINTSELEKELQRLETEFQSEKKEREILQLTNKNNEVALELEKKKGQNYLLLLASLSFLFLSILTYLGYRNFKKQNRIKANELGKLKMEQEAKMYNAILEGQEKERQRLAIDLHDGLAGRLSALKMNSEKMAKKAGGTTDEKNYRSVSKRIDDSLYELRTIARNLMPETLFKYGIENAVKDFCSSINADNKKLNFILQFYDTDRQIGQNTSLTLYRIIQELVNNAVKHAAATEVLVQYLIDHDKINITVEDNGIGFEIKKENSKRGMGLENLKTRVAYLNGEIDFGTAPGEGTTVHIVIPI